MKWNKIVLITFLISACSTTKVERKPSSQIDSIRSNLVNTNSVVFPEGTFSKKTVHIPLHASSPLIDYKLGRGAAESKIKGMDCVLGNQVLSRLKPRLDFFIKQDESSSYPKQLRYIVGVRIVSGINELQQASIHPSWWKISHEDEEKFIEKCGTHYFSAEEYGISMSKKIVVSHFDSSPTPVEFYSDFNSFKKRLDEFNLEEDNLNFNVGFIDTDEKITANFIYKDKKFSGFENFIETFWTKPTPEVQSSVINSRSTVGVYYKAIPQRH